MSQRLINMIYAKMICLFDLVCLPQFELRQTVKQSNFVTGDLC